MEQSQRVLGYWRQSVEDGNRLDFKEEDIQDINYVEQAEIKAGELSPSSFEKVEKKADGQQGALDLMICPFPLKQKRKDDTEAHFFPLIIPARLEEDGSLEPQKDCPPFIPRKYLEPTEQDGYYLGQAAAAEEYREKYPHPGEGTWEMVWQDAWQLFKKVSGKNPDRIERKGFSKMNQSAVWFGKVTSGAYLHVTPCYEDLCKQKTLPPLLTSFTGSGRSGQEMARADHFKYGPRHVGQMGDEHPLTPSQREALHHFFALEEGEILGVNGPPGTGKTTMIQSVVSSLWIERALEESEPPVIIASSSNNTAVLNILDSFQKAAGQKPKDEALTSLASRWIPKVNSYGLFCASKNKYEELSGQYPSILCRYNKTYRRYEFVGFLPDLEAGNLQEKVDFFLQQCTDYFGEPIGDLRQAKQRLHRELVRVSEKVKGRSFDYYEWLQLWQRLQEEFGSQEKLEQAIAERTPKEEASRSQKEFWEKVYTEWLDHVNGRSWWQRLFRPLQGPANESFLRKKGIDEAFVSYKDADVKAVLSQKEAEAKQEHDRHHQQLSDWKQLRDRLQELDEAWSQEKGKEGFFKKLDTRWRYQAFLLATHYWEARWLEELRAEPNPAEESEEERWRRYAKLTPCFVVTTLSVPNYFRRFRKPREYLYQFADLLVIDEAGQITPEQAAPAFSLAKRALVVGDTEQLQPIPRVHPPVDRANLKAYGLLREEADFESFSQSGRAVSTGSVMKIAQQVSRYRKYENMGGMLLTEHHRCVKDIIQYCNDLCYHGRLRPKRKNPAPDKAPYGDLPRLGSFHVEGMAEQKDGSWENHQEAATIAWWIHHMSEKWTKGNRRLKDVVAVVSPFRKQARLISRYLKKEYGIDGLTINTVHALQGAEKDIVIFSATYGGEDVKQKTLFYDTTRYLLNVAVSRAKESFIVFGDMSIFGRSPQQPSGKLKERLQPLPEHLAQVPEPTIEEMVSRMKGRVKTNKKVEKNVTIINNNNGGNVNIATDHSTLQVNEGAELSSQLIEDLRKEMSQVRQVSEKEKEEILQLLKALKQSKEKKEYKKMDRLLQRLRRWQPLFDGLNATGQTAANIMNIFK